MTIGCMPPIHRSTSEDSALQSLDLAIALPMTSSEIPKHLLLLQMCVTRSDVAALLSALLAPGETVRDGSFSVKSAPDARRDRCKTPSAGILRLLKACGLAALLPKAPSLLFRELPLSLRHREMSNSVLYGRYLKSPFE